MELGPRRRLLLRGLEACRPNGLCLYHLGRAFATYFHRVIIAPPARPPPQLPLHTHARDTFRLSLRTRSSLEGDVAFFGADTCLGVAVVVLIQWILEPGDGCLFTATEYIGDRR